MANLNKELEVISRLERDTEAGLMSRVTETRKEISEKKELVRKRIMAGETTGNRIRDFVIMAQGAPNEEVEKIYRELEAKIAAHVGEFILLVGRSYEFHGCTGFGYKPRPREYVLEEYICLGILNGPKLLFNFKDSQCEIPTSKYARPWRQEEVRVEDGNIKNHCIGVLGLYWSILELGKLAKIKNNYGIDLDLEFMALPQPENLKLEIKIGDVEVDAWFKEHKRHEKTYQKLCKALGRIALETPEIKEKQKETLKILAELTQEYKNNLSEIRDATEFLRFQKDKSNIVLIEQFANSSINPEKIRKLAEKLQQLHRDISEKIVEAIRLGLNNNKAVQNISRAFKTPQ